MKTYYPEYLNTYKTPNICADSQYPFLKHAELKTLNEKQQLKYVSKTLPDGKTISSYFKPKNKSFQGVGLTINVQSSTKEVGEYS